MVMIVMRTHNIGLTALESWCLACIALVFQALVSYVLILARVIIAKEKRSNNWKKSQEDVDNGKRDLMLELILFSWVFGSALLFCVYYWTTESVNLWRGSFKSLLFFQIIWTPIRFHFRCYILDVNEGCRLGSSNFINFTLKLMTKTKHIHLSLWKEIRVSICP